MEPGAEHRIVSPRWARITTAPFEFGLAWAALATGAIYLVSPAMLRATSLANVLPMWGSYLISVGYVVGGFATLTGIWWGNRDIESAGMWALASTLAIGVVIRWHLLGADAATSIITQTCFATACVFRAFILRRYRLAVIVDGGDGHGK